MSFMHARVRPASRPPPGAGLLGLPKYTVGPGGWQFPALVIHLDLEANRDAWQGRPPHHIPTRHHRTWKMRGTAPTIAAAHLACAF